MTEEKTLRINDYNFDYRVQGSGERKIFIHGSASDRRTWNKQMDALSKYYQVIAYSRRYHWPNKKINAEDNYSMQQHVKDLEGIIHFFGSGPIHLSGSD